MRSSFSCQHCLPDGLIVAGSSRRISTTCLPEELSVSSGPVDATSGRRVPVTAVTASVEKNRSINMPGGGFRWNVNYGQHTIFGLKGCSMIRRSTWRPQCPPLGGPGPARSARARRMRWRRWRHRNKETAAAAALRGKVVMAARVTGVAATSGGAAAKSEDGAPWRPPPPESGGTSAFSDSWPCCCREPSRGSLLLEGFRVLLVGSGGWLLRNTAVYIT